MLLVIYIVSLVACVLLFIIFIYRERLIGQMAKYEFDPSAAERRRLVETLEAKPQSGFWINCATHGNVPLTEEEYGKQKKNEHCKCPLCGHIPRKIWKNVAAML